jgi:hypothetical protein
MVRISDSSHVWCETDGGSLRLLASCRAQRPNLGVIAVVDESQELPVVALSRAPSNHPFSLITLPGAHQKFALLADSESGLYWSVGNLSRSGMRAVRRLDDGHVGLPGDDCDRLALHVSRNLVDWEFAGLIDGCHGGQVSCFECSMDVRGNDMYVVARCATEGRRHAGDTNQIRLYEVPQFRELAY